jgi:hypothetical protein
MPFEQNRVIPNSLYISTYTHSGVTLGKTCLPKKEAEGEKDLANLGREVVICLGESHETNTRY